MPNRTLAHSPNRRTVSRVPSPILKTTHANITLAQRCCTRELAFQSKLYYIPLNPRVISGEQNSLSPIRDLLSGKISRSLRLQQSESPLARALECLICYGTFSAPLSLAAERTGYALSVDISDVRVQAFITQDLDTPTLSPRRLVYIAAVGIYGLHWIREFRWSIYWVRFTFCTW